MATATGTGVTCAATELHLNAVAMNLLPSSSLLQSRPARIEWARQRFFEEGRAPTGIVSEAVFESWSRCMRLHGAPNSPATFQPVTASRAQLALTKNRPLHQAWLAEVPRLDSILGSTTCTAMLTDATGVLIGSSCVGRPHEALMPVATRIGVNLSEDAVGTTAPGVAARTGKAVCVLGGEHFFDNVKEMHCAASPIRDIRGQLAGVLDISSERIAFAFDATAIVGIFAGAIENRLLVAQSTQHLVIRLQVAEDLLDSSMVGLVGIDVQGRLAWGNAVARSLLGLPGQPSHQPVHSPDEVFGLRCSQLAALPAAGAARLALPNGLHVWARADMRAPDGRRGLVAGPGAPSVAPAAMPSQAVPDPSPAVDIASVPQTSDVGTADVDARADQAQAVAAQRLRESDLELIQKTLQACGGNVSTAARQLGVSRGLIYRRLRAAHEDSKATSA